MGEIAKDAESGEGSDPRTKPRTKTESLSRCIAVGDTYYEDTSGLLLPEELPLRVE